MELATTPAFAVLHQPGASGKRTFRISSSLEPVLRDWNSSTRISPVYPLVKNAADAPADFAFPKGNSVFFIGPVSPPTLVPLSKVGRMMWATLGAFNIILRTTAADGTRVARWLKAHGVRFEHWPVVNGVVGKARRSRTLPVAQEPLDDLADLLSHSTSAEERHSLIEYCPLMASALVRATAAMPAFLPDLTETHALVRSTLERSDLDVYARVGILTTVNAALARLTSDSLSGSSNVLETECHLWSHSLLGIGLANAALARVRSFVYERLAKAYIPERVEALAVIRDFPSLRKHPDNDAFWLKDHLKDAVPARDPKDPLFSPLIYFSGRDHFRSSLNTLSAPFASIAGCNSVRWSLMTLTHEISHIVLRGVMSVIYPDPASDCDMRDARRYLSAAPRENLLDEIRFLLLQSAVGMDMAHRLDMRDTTGNVKVMIDDLSGVVRRWHHEIEEIMTHVFDFLYFYGGDEERYIRAIWLSWSVIPAISSKIPQYVIRSLCVLTSKFQKHGDKTQEIARARLTHLLEQLKQEPEKVNYIDEALHYLRDEPGDIDSQLVARHLLVKVVRSFLYSEQIAALVGKETRLVSGETSRQGYGLRWHDLDLPEIDNPLRFLSMYTDAHRPNETRSAWMLHVLAFATAAP